MTTTSSPRSVEIQRVSAGKFVAINARGGRLEFGGGDALFSPVELLLVAIGGCSGFDVDSITARRAEPTEFTVTVSANSIRNDDGNHLEDIDVAFDLVFPDGDVGDKAREVLPQAIQKTHDRLCTVSRTVEMALPIKMRIVDEA
ncbi:MAG: OsmC family protein [Nakamurella sp.]